MVPLGLLPWTVVAFARLFVHMSPFSVSWFGLYVFSMRRPRWPSSPLTVFPLLVLTVSEDARLEPLADLRFPVPPENLPKESRR